MLREGKSRLQMSKVQAQRDLLDPHDHSIIISRPCHRGEDLIAQMGAGHRSRSWAAIGFSTRRPRGRLSVGKTTAGSPRPRRRGRNGGERARLSLRPSARRPRAPLSREESARTSARANTRRVPSVARETSDQPVRRLTPPLKKGQQRKEKKQR